MQRLFGTTEVPWGQVNVTVRGGTFPMDGTGLYDVLHPDDGPEQDSGQIFDNDGWGHVMIVMEGEPKQIWSLLPYGESEDPASPHYNDQTKLQSPTTQAILVLTATNHGSYGIGLGRP